MSTRADEKHVSTPR